MTAVGRERTYRVVFRFGDAMDRVDVVAAGPWSAAVAARPLLPPGVEIVYVHRAEFADDASERAS